MAKEHIIVDTVPDIIDVAEAEWTRTQSQT
jgi:hypothetical protein